MMRKTGGFTLVELLVVIGIMMVLTTITVSQFTTARLRAADVQRKADLTSLSRALLAYFNANFRHSLDYIGVGMSRRSRSRRTGDRTTLRQFVEEGFSHLAPPRVVHTDK